MGDKLEVFTLHSKGEKNGVPFSPSSIPLSTFETVVSNVSLPPDQSSWIDSDSYVMAEVTDLGGKSKANVHLEIEGRGTVVAESLRQYLSDLTENLLYKKVLAHVAYRKNLQTGEWNKPRLIAIENPVRHQFDEKAFEQAIARPNGWEDVTDPVAEIRRLRGEDVGDRGGVVA